MASIRSRWAVALMAVAAALGFNVSATSVASAAGYEFNDVYVYPENRDVCRVAYERRFYGASNEKCPKYKWNPLKGCLADGCCCLDACSPACRKAYCVLKQQWSIDPSNYCGESFECLKEWVCERK